MVGQRHPPIAWVRVRIRVPDGGPEHDAVQSRAARRSCVFKGAEMGDKGGKKDKDKQKQQQLKKHEQDDQKKHDRTPSQAASLPGAGIRTGSSSGGPRK